MKKVVFLLSFFLALGIATANAQSCGSAKSTSATTGKSCCASKAAAAAKADPTIESTVDANGAVSYMRKETDQTGNVRLVSVQYDEASNVFVNVAPKSADTTEGMVKKSCGTSTATGTKACCSSGKSEGKACCAKKEQ